MTSTTEPRPHRAASTDTYLDWLLEDLVARSPHIRQAVILSRDGFALGTSAALGGKDAEHLAALAAGLASLANGGAHHFGTGAVRQTLVEMDQGFLLVTAAGAGTCLAVLADAEADVGLLGYEMAMVVKQLGQHMAVGSRPAPEHGEAM